MSTKKEVKSWDSLIEEARQKLAEGKAYVKQMREALKIFERNKAMGVAQPRERRKAVA